MSEKLRLLATAAFGLEGIAASELKRLGFEAKGFHGGASFTGSYEDAFLANLWLRSADRVLIELGRFRAESFEALFEGVKALPLEDYLPRDAFLHLTASCARSTLMAPSSVQSIAKKAAAARLQGVYQIGWLPETGPRYRLDVHIHEDEAVVALDTSGPGLSRRGYRTFNAVAPLRESLAAAMVMTSPWRPWLPFFDPMCGSGTLPIEAAFIALDRAPGLLRPFAMEEWPACDKAACQRLREEAAERFEAKKAERQASPEPLRVQGSDIDASVLNMALTHLRQAGLTGLVRFEKRELKDAQNPFGEERGTVVTNPPYGERMGDEAQAEGIYQELRMLHNRLPGWGFSVISSHKGFERVFGKRADKKRRVYNGRIECEIFNYFPPRAPKEQPGEDG
ncbi:MAG: class I SAM-dependent RNA methyltransferase [Christensenellaceae bacterium]|jgi:putative N6-adenine-specific DNA methylase|nr:class I SAM-dependent RNA methyltransferase [Christensenellaceae bacterium]